jgi:hypothetical protein
MGLNFAPAVLMVIGDALGEHGGRRHTRRVGAWRPAARWAAWASSRRRKQEPGDGPAGLLPWLSVTRWASSWRWPEPGDCRQRVGRALEGGRSLEIAGETGD